MKYKTVFISDLHIGSRGCRHAELMNFLSTIETKELYLVGDIIDGWRLKRSFYFPQEHVDIIRKILSLAKSGVKVTYIPGNHDEFLRQFHDFDITLGNISVIMSDVYTMPTGKKYLVVHGDAFDQVTKYYKFVAILGDVGYNFLIWVNLYFNKIRKFFGLRYWSLSKFVKHKAKEAANFINAFETSAAKAAKNLGYDGIICGHIHKAESRYFDGIHYVNDGDFVETCSAFAVKDDGTIYLIELNTDYDEFYFESKDVTSY